LAAAQPDLLHKLDAALNVDGAHSADLGVKSGLFPRQRLLAMIKREMIVATEPFDANQIQPASLDLRIGARAYRIRASFLPGVTRTVQDQLKLMNSEAIDLASGAVLEKNCVYLVELQEHLDLQPTIFGLANPKSSTGRLDIFTRVIADNSDRFDFVPGGYNGPLYAEISPRSFSVKVRKGSKLNQIRFRRRNPTQSESHDSFYLSDRELQAKHKLSPLVDEGLVLRDGLVVSVALSITNEPREVIGYKALKHTDPIDVDRVAGYDVDAYWEPVHKTADNTLILDPDSFYILASKERLHVPPNLAAEMVPIDPRMGEFRVHYAGFFDPGFGHSAAGAAGARAVLEVRSREVAFLIEHGQMVGRLVYEEMTDSADALYGQQGSNYQAQGLKLSKHFKPLPR
jgi:dCTP deaminase